MPGSEDPILPAGYRLVARDSVGSTNDEARALLAGGDPARTVVWAKSQSAGRGRYGRVWASPPGNLYCSVLLRPEIEPKHLGEAAFVAALAVRDVVAAYLPSALPVEFKWPNDVLAAGRKLAGILVESENRPGDARSALIVGIGINIVSAPEETTYPATFLAALAPPLGVAQLLQDVTAALDRRIALWERAGFADIRRDWLDHAYGVGRPVAAEGGVTGTFAGIDETGAIIIARAGGGNRHIASGGVRYL